MKGVGRAIGLARAAFVGRPAPHRVESSATVMLIAICARAKTPIVGFDGETQSSAEAVIDLIEEVAIPVCMVGLLRALPNTQLGRCLSCMYSRCDWARKVVVTGQSGAREMKPVRVSISSIGGLTLGR
jgi:hypothetical protein